MNKDLVDFTDLELAQAVIQLFGQRDLINQQIPLVNTEIERRKNLNQPQQATGEQEA